MTYFPFNKKKQYFSMYAFTAIQKSTVIESREGTMDCLLHYSPKFYNIFVFVGLTTLGTLNFDWLVYKVECLYISSQPLILIYKKEVILCIIIGDVRQFIGHCLFPLDPCT